ncbi:tumor necrosis factor alpha-induced protein 2-like [Protopterus annectens]|uniref:tumor necrosis factor alpha-induced protein 2-like n=1 Tax=Protopterus annectens TaxID=7888 RepID=UPI001CF940E6|nr:tumor necrosis factor alpha-induced protein 2-like [Protopterus annectens]
MFDKALRIHVKLYGSIQQECFAEFLTILKGYQKHLNNFLQHCKNTRVCKNYYLHVIEIIEGCHNLREYLCQLPNYSDETKQATVILSSVERETCKLIVQDLCSEFKPILKRHFSKEEHDFETDISQVLSKCFHSVVQRQSSICKALVESAYKRISQLYVETLLNSSVKSTSPTWRNIADTICNDTNALQNTFQCFNDGAILPNDHLMDVAEIIKTNDCEALKLLVGVLKHKNPHFRKEHLLAVLKIKGNVKWRERNVVLQYLKDEQEEPARSSDHCFFREIKIKKSFCLFCICCLC